MALHIRFKKLVIDNFLSIGHGEIDLADRGYTLIEGINNDPRDGAKSNGSGKSSIASAICYALTGETIQGVSSDLINRNTEGDMGVDLSFSVNDTEFRVVRTRTRKDKPNLKIFVDGEDRSGKTLRDGEAILKQYLPSLTGEFIGELVIIGQGMPHRFSRCKPSERKAILENLSNNDLAISDLKERVDKRKKEIAASLRDAEMNRAKLDTEKALRTREKEENDAKLAELEVESKVDYSKAIPQAQKKVDELVAKHEASIRVYKAADERAVADAAAKVELIEKRSAEHRSNAESYSEAKGKITEQISRSRASLDVVVEELSKKEKITDVCPTCGQKISGVHKPDLTEDKAKRKSLEEEISALTAKSADMKARFDEYEKSIDRDYAQAIDAAQKNAEASRADAEKLRAEAFDTAELEAARRELTSLESARDLLAARRSEAEKKAADLESTLNSIENKIVYNDGEIQNLTDRQAVVSKMETYVQRDFRGMLIESVISFVNAKAREYAGKMFGTDDIEFVLDDNDIDIKFRGKLLGTLSGGEQRKVDLIVQFALRAMVKEYADFDSNVLVLDEILDNLDSVGCDEVLNFVNAELSDVESVFIISHHADSLNICNDSTIKVIKNEEGVSYISEE